MKKKLLLDKARCFLISILFFVTIFSAIFFHQPVSAKTDEEKPTIIFSQEFSNPEIIYYEDYLEIYVEKVDSYSIIEGKPRLPVFTKTFELPWGSNSIEIKVDYSDINSLSISKKVKLVPKYNPINKDILINIEHEYIDQPFPNYWYELEKGAGLNDNNEHVLFLSFSIYPIRYLSSEKIEYINEINFKISYKRNDVRNFNSDIYDLVIISPEQFKKNLTSLITHKNNYNVRTNYFSLEEIYEQYLGIDKTEQIKYFIKYAVEEWGIKYVLLVGDIKKLPIRCTDAYPWNNFHGYGLLSDLYYSDIYDESYNFCDWDANNNNIFGEIKIIGPWYNEEIIDLDDVDLYPDIHIGRLACRNNKEVETMVNKIITYEETVYEQTWFKKIILAGGDTFPPDKNSPPFVFEGEIVSEKIIQETPEFQHIKLWSSKRNLNAFTFNRAISKGAGFVSYSGHGFEHGWGTYKPNSIRKKLDFLQPMYFTPFIQFLKNKDKLPIIFFDACLTTKLDFNISDLKSYYKSVRFLLKLYGFDFDSSNYFPCFAWCFMMKEDGGAIATIGATRPAYSHVDDKGIHAGAGYLNWMFFKSYEKGISVGEMFTKAQNNYLNNKGKDYFTIEEFMLLGDPSLRTGGYS